MEKEEYSVLQNIQSMVLNCDFTKAIIDDPKPNNFYQILYSNRAVVPDEYIPKPLSFEATGEED